MNFDRFRTFDILLHGLMRLSLTSMGFFFIKYYIRLEVFRKDFLHHLLFHEENLYSLGKITVHGLGKLKVHSPHQRINGISESI